MTRRAQRLFGFMLMALFMRLLVPDGYMLDATGQGPAIVLCNGGGPELPAGGGHGAHTGHHHRDPGSGDDRGAHSVCPYAALAAPSSPPSSPAIAPPPPPSALSPVVLASGRTAGSSLAAPPPPATGPPPSA